MSDKRQFKCYACGHEWAIPYGTGQSGVQLKCPKCESDNIHRIGDGGAGRGPSPQGRGRGGPGRGPRFAE